MCLSIFSFTNFLLSFLLPIVGSTKSGSLLVVTLQDGEWLSDSVQRLSKNLDKWGYSHEELLGQRNERPHLTWLIETVQTVANTTDYEYLFIISRASAIFTKKPQVVVDSLKQEEKIIVIDSTMATNCSDEKQVCKISERIPLVIAGARHKILTVCELAKLEPSSVWDYNQLKSMVTNTNYSQIITLVENALSEENVSAEGSISEYMSTATPVLVATNHLSRMVLNQMANYIAETTECYNCYLPDGTTTKLSGEFGIALFIEKPTPFIKQFLTRILALDYPKSRTTLLVHNALDYHNKTIEDFLAVAASQFKTVQYIASYDDATENEARMDAIKYCYDKKMDHCFFVSSTALLDNANVITDLVQLNRSVIAPLLVRQYSYWSNFWGLVSESGFYDRSFDYMAIVNRSMRGVWNVPYISDCYLMNKTAIERLNHRRFTGDYDIAFPDALREQDMFMFLSNLDYYGLLTNTENYNTSLPRPDFYEIFNNYDQWVEKYINEEFWSFLNGSKTAKELATDIFWFPLVSDDFCDDIVATAVALDLWSGGKHVDARIPGGYENVPTDDVHMHQIGFSDGWSLVLRNFVMPIQRRLFEGYLQDPPRAPLSFVVRYHPERQDRLKPHHDASTYTINIALNTPGIDYQGGGVRFHRYNVNVTDLKKGWLLMHPGRLTHLHEGLPTTNGTRYIFISFVDP